MALLVALALIGYTYKQVVARQRECEDRLTFLETSATTSSLDFRKFCDQETFFKYFTEAQFGCHLGQLKLPGVYSEDIHNWKTTVYTQAIRDKDPKVNPDAHPRRPGCGPGTVATGSR